MGELRERMENDLIIRGNILAFDPPAGCGNATIKWVVPPSDSPFAELITRIFRQDPEEFLGFGTFSVFQSRNCTPSRTRTPITTPTPPTTSVFREGVEVDV